MQIVEDKRLIRSILEDITLLNGEQTLTYKASPMVMMVHHRLKVPR